MKKPILFFFILTCTIVTAQNKRSNTTADKPAVETAKPANEARNNDWDTLDKAFIALIDALIKGDKAKFVQLSLKEVDCVDCIGPTEITKDGAFVPAEFFFAVIGQKFTDSPVYKAMASRGYSFSTVVLKGFKPKVLPADYPDNLKLYDVWVETYRPGEFSKNHKGTSHSFRFVKVRGKFKFYGLTSLP
ncbi:hypothetical protein CHU92_10675 [Flavobacterium cyanobacteriorum]|uniref:Uncharacterized protein n=1 Tax=Flavobacterium cyanobacteriorum TaxID=2022802 RepID=A0A255Z2K3_9FLAO|nr:hypothetical protein [Flavobacterium cyanobacteriorum]OYQ35669.1 hypothetical protein CHU92_10675 [Flavobacterium cyanobacteriorum]